MTSSSSQPIARKRFAPYLYLAGALILLFAMLAFGPRMRVGDAAEYYGLFYAWDLTHRPWMTAPAYAAYDALFHSNTIAGLIPVDMLANAFPALRVGATSDFNHFWFYSFLAAACARLAGLVGIELGPHQSFLFLHAMLAYLALGLAYRYHGWRGALAAGLMLFASPVLWFANKAHTEWMTVCLVLGAVAALTARHYLVAALLVALAAPQNPSFALAACIPLAYRVVLQRARPYTLAEVAMGAAIVIAVLMHPVYYFSRYGVPTPQLLAGGAELGRDLSTFYVWIIDPDLGLLPNWPLGLLVLATASVLFLFARGRGAARPDRPWWFFLLAYLLLNFFAHASTTNLNSGATPGLARYALWYLPLAFPVFLYVLARIAPRSRGFYVAALAAALLLVASVVVNDPRRSERYWVPSELSGFLQKRLPALYDPPGEVFAERFSGVGEGVHALQLRAVVGPDCRKALIMPGAQRHGALAPAHCVYDKQGLDAYVDATYGKPAGDEPYYTRLPADTGARLGFTVRPGPHAAGIGGDAGPFLVRGWSVPEAWGIWSSGKRAEIMFPCNDQQYYGAGKPFSLALKLRPFLTQNIEISGKGGTLWKGPVNAVDQMISFNVPATHCDDGQYRLRIALPDAVSPQEKGMSADPRVLAVGLSSLEIVAAPADAAAR